ncbi:glycosyltransferase [Formosa sp. L2A11]|uniref:glycosyltransferase n=1 Tax=Formosa sp. L2A11 TaxID=2686363 RepID=UPI00131C468B|nr:glycosyltransferase [Formosa sp. L2A11]
MKVTVVTVTYGNRYIYLSQVIEACIKQFVDKIIIVSNGSEESALKQLKQLSVANNCIKLIDLEENTGSANGFYQGLKEAHNSGAEFIWILDDDNKPLENALLELKMFWQTNTLSNKESALLSYRKDREIFKKAIQSSNPYFMLGTRNSFLGFSVLSKLKKILFKDNVYYNPDITHGKVAVAPYGGLFFHSNLIDEIGLPDKDFFLYADDHDFSYRITQGKGEIILVLKSELEDLETSFHLKKSKSILNTRYFGTDSKKAIFYSVRNNVFFEKKFRNNILLYNCNKITYLILLFIIMIFNPRNFWKFSVIINAINDSKKFKEND